MNQSPSASGSFTLAVPEAYVRHLSRRVNLIWLVIPAWMILMLFVYFHGSRRPLTVNTISLISSFLPLLMMFPVWQMLKKKPWRHKFDDFTINIIDGVSLLIPEQTLRRIRLGRRVDVVTRWEDTRWNDLAALRIFVEGRYFWHRRTLLIVYSPNEESIVQARVIPLLITYLPENKQPDGVESHAA